MPGTDQVNTGAHIRVSRWSQSAACVVASLFLLGFFIHAIGMWTGVILGVWFVGTQKLRGGFLWMAAISLLFSLPGTWRLFAQTVFTHGASRFPEFVGQFAGMVVLAVLLGVLPFTFHRLISPRLPGFFSTLPFPLAAVALRALILEIDPASQVGPDSGNGLLTFFISWFAAVIVWMWNYEFRAAKILQGAAVFVAVCCGTVGLWLALHFNIVVLPQSWNGHGVLTQTCVGGALMLSIWALFRPEKRRTWAERAQAVASLRSPFTGERLRVESEPHGEALVSVSRERFPVRDGIPTFLKPEDLTGNNGKYNHQYETIGGFYDDIQRIFLAIAGVDRDAYFRSYMNRLEVKPGDAVLETSVGTGLNYKYLPRDVKLSGLDLSPEMLANCQRNLRRWDLDADLYLGNAESLPFADESFDVVFHVGGINFFNDRAKAIREMIRVAKPGSLLLISDETEKHVKAVYEKQPGGMFKNRTKPVSPPVDLVPSEMTEVHLELLRGGDTYALTFRKPAAHAGRSLNAASAAESILCAQETAVPVLH
jgi:ubiquinone/menaquinone biosynthesis C-methylase UbiE